MRLMERKLWPGDDGSLVVPADVLNEVGKGPEGEIHITYLREEGDGKGAEVFLSGVEAGSLTPGQLCEEGMQLMVPEELFQEAGIGTDEDLEVVCGERRITILPADTVGQVPHEILELCGELGISPDKVRVIMEMEGFNGREETDLPDSGQ